MRKGASVTRNLIPSAACCAAAACLIVPVAVMPTAQALPGDTHITGTGVEQALDCNESTLFVNGTGNVITATGVCYGVTLQGTGNVVIADTVINDITVYGYNQTVLYKNGEPFVWDRGRELGMTNRVDRVPA
jgi:hypothetical protein